MWWPSHLFDSEFGIGNWELRFHLDFVIRASDFGTRRLLAIPSRPVAVGVVVEIRWGSLPWCAISLMPSAKDILFPGSQFLQQSGFALIFGETIRR